MVARLSVVVVAYDMGRELPRTLRTLGSGHQRGITSDQYEVILVDNGSPAPVDPRVADEFDGELHLLRIDDASPSPAAAANLGVAAARGDVVGLIIDGARMASPGLLATALAGAGLAERAVVTAPAWHLGSVPHMRAAEVAYDQAVEDRLLAGVDWERDGYELFSVACFAGSSWRGVFGPMGESSSLFLGRGLWEDLGGVDEAFDLPGGGLMNHDLYRRACAAQGIELIEMLGEGTFHQFHGGAATSRRFGWKEMQAAYAKLRGQPYRPPQNRARYIGSVHPAYLPHLEESVRLALDGFSSRP